MNLTKKSISRYAKTRVCFFPYKIDLLLTFFFFIFFLLDRACFDDEPERFQLALPALKMRVYVHHRPICRSTLTALSAKVSAR